MNLTATEAKNRLGQVLETAQREPVFIDKSGRRHSVVISAGRYEELLRAEADRSKQPSMDERRQRFNEQYKDWIELQNQFVAEYGVFGEEWRQW
jgi:prevent-host-death family protein